MTNITFTNLPTNLTNLTATASYMNTITQSYFWSIILFVAFIISFIVLNSKNTPSESVLVSSFMTTVLGTLLFFAGLISSNALFLSFGLLVLSVIAKFFFD